MRNCFISKQILYKEVCSAVYFIEYQGDMISQVYAVCGKGEHAWPDLYQGKFEQYWEDRIRIVWPRNSHIFQGLITL